MLMSLVADDCGPGEDEVQGGKLGGALTPIVAYSNVALKAFLPFGAALSIAFVHKIARLRI